MRKKKRRGNQQTNKNTNPSETKKRAYEYIYININISITSKANSMQPLHHRDVFLMLAKRRSRLDMLFHNSRGDSESGKMNMLDAT